MIRNQVRRDSYLNIAWTRAEHRKLLGLQIVCALQRAVALFERPSDSKTVMGALETMCLTVTECCREFNSQNVRIMLLDGATYLNEQILASPPEAHYAAARLKEYFDRAGFAELTIAADVGREHMTALCQGLARGAPIASESEIRTQAVSTYFPSSDDPGEHVLAAYASALVVLRELYEQLQTGQCLQSRRLLRIAQRLVSIAEKHSNLLLAVTAGRITEPDEAARAVHTSIVALLMARKLTVHRGTLRALVQAALLQNVGMPRLMDVPGPLLALDDAQLAQLPASTLAVMTALGGLGQATMMESIIAFEALWCGQTERLGPHYLGRRDASLLAHILAVARRFNDLMVFAPHATPPSIDEVVQHLSDEAMTEGDRHLVSLLVAALGVFPIGCVVELNTGEVAAVTTIPYLPVFAPCPPVRILYDSSGNKVPGSVEVDLAGDPDPGQPRRFVCALSTGDLSQAKSMRSYMLTTIGGDHPSLSPPAMPPHETMPPSIERTLVPPGGPPNNPAAQAAVPLGVQPVSNVPAATTSTGSVSYQIVGRGAGSARTALAPISSQPRTQAQHERVGQAPGQPPPSSKPGLSQHALQAAAPVPSSIPPRETIGHRSEQPSAPPPTLRAASGHSSQSSAALPGSSPPASARDLLGPDPDFMVIGTHSAQPPANAFQKPIQQQRVGGTYEVVGRRAAITRPPVATNSAAPPTISDEIEISGPTTSNAPSTEPEQSWKPPVFAPEDDRDDTDLLLAGVELDNEAEPLRLPNKASKPT